MLTMVPLTDNETTLLKRIERLEALLDEDRVIAPKLIIRADRAEAFIERLIEVGRRAVQNPAVSADITRDWVAIINEYRASKTEANHDKQ